MRIPRVFSEQELRESCEIELDEAASHHLIKVLRMQPGRPLILFNGRGGEFEAELVSTTKKTATVYLKTYTDKNPESPLHTHLAISLSRGERFEFVLQKATELGVSAITPLLTERTEVKLSGERLEKKIKSWWKIIIGACEQCGRCVPPVLNAPEQIQNFLAKPYNGECFVLHHRNTSTLDPSKQIENINLLIGPEGGLSESEIALANQRGWKNLVLGPRVLRTETAPIVALSLFQHHWGDI